MSTIDTDTATREELVAAILGMGTVGVDVRTIARQVEPLIPPRFPLGGFLAVCLRRH